MSQERRAKIGFLINPIAGMGGKVGLKGTDGLAGLALAKGAIPQSEERARACLQSPIWRSIDIQFFAAGGSMGENLLASRDIAHEVIFRPPNQSGPADTIAACREFWKRGVDLILFCGGDGTARDVASASRNMPMLGIPAGVKMHSGVFAVSPQAAAELAVRYLRGEIKLRQTEIVDVDEDLYRSGELATRLYAAALTPYQPALVQERKRIYLSGDEEEFKDQIALFAAEFMRDGSAYIIGAGTTTARIAERLGLEKTLLGVDVIQNGRLVQKDTSENDLLALLDKEARVKIIVSPIGAQGFILGRGSQQISPAVLRRVGEENLIIVSTPHKMAEIPRLLVDTGDADLDRILAKKRLVVIGYRMAQRKETAAASLC
ncbi:MAG TPA: ATP-NAD kinase family protein [Methanothrix sp.]|nr:ATP-NAD kinase family protein [Methanothrix sp.]